jgi:hypothetical protein
LAISLTLLLIQILSTSNLAPKNSVVERNTDKPSGRGNRHGAQTGGVLGISGSHATPGSGTAQNTAGEYFE